jgi:hypothetical protein
MNEKRLSKSERRRAGAAYAAAPYGTVPAGECGFCGHWDKRHRMWDVIGDRFLAGESIEGLARDYDYSDEAMENWLRLALQAARARGRRPKRAPRP